MHSLLSLSCSSLSSCSMVALLMSLDHNGRTSNADIYLTIIIERAKAPKSSGKLNNKE
jgi:hypothetical protein